MSKNKRQHYISAFYLYNFTNDEQRKGSTKKRKTKIFHYDFNKNKISERPIDNIAWESYLFSYKQADGIFNHDLDEKLKSVEDKAAIAIDHLTDTYSNLIKSKKDRIEINNDAIDDLIELISWQIRRHPEFVGEIEEECKAFLTEKGISSYSAKQMALEAVQSIGDLGGISILEELKKKNKYIFFTTGANAHFITTDKPFVRFNKHHKNGIVVPGTEMYFPITSNLFLMLHGNGNEKRLIHLNDGKRLREINTFMAKQAKYYLFGRSDVYLSRLLKNLN